MLTDKLEKFTIRKLILYIPSQNANTLTSLNAILGQNGINVFEFNKMFNSITKYYLEDIILRVEILLYSDKKFDLIVTRPSTAFLLKEEFLVTNKIENENDIFLTLYTLYKISIFIKLLSKENKTHRSIFRSLLGTIKSSKINILNDFN
jgi:ribosomal protein L11